MVYICPGGNCTGIAIFFLTKCHIWNTLIYTNRTKSASHWPVPWPNVEDCRRPSYNFVIVTKADNLESDRIVLSLKPSQPLSCVMDKMFAGWWILISSKKCKLAISWILIGLPSFSWILIGLPSSAGPAAAQRAHNLNKANLASELPISWSLGTFFLLIQQIGYEAWGEMGRVWQHWDEDHLYC